MWGIKKYLKFYFSFSLTLPKHQKTPVIIAYPKPSPLQYYLFSPLPMKPILLARGLPPISVMRKFSSAILRAYKTVAKEDESAFLQYGHFAGYEPLREKVAEKFSVEKKRVFISNGSMDALNHFLLFLKTRGEIGAYIAGKEVYDRPLIIAKILELSPQSISMKNEGLNTEEAEEKIKNTSQKGVFYTIPWYDNPSGIFHTEENIQTISTIAKENDWLVIRDGAYLDLSYFEPIIPLPVEDHVLQTFSWSKTINAASHTGGIIIPERYTDDFLSFLSSWRLSPVLPTQAVTFQLLKNGDWERHIQENVLPDGRERVSQFNELMEKYLPESKQRNIRGGHFWGGKISGITLDNWDQFVQIAKEQFGLHIPHHGGFLPLALPEESAGYVRIPLFLEDPDIPNILERIVSGIAEARSLCL